MKENHLKQLKRGSVLILALWVLSFLSILAIQLGAGIRQRITFVSRIEERSNLFAIADAGVQRAIAQLISDFEDAPEQYKAANKVARHNNEGQFKDVALGQGGYEVFYSNERLPDGKDVQKFGLIDEESKLNLNKASVFEIRNLLISALGMDEDKAVDLANAIVGWREIGGTELIGFYSDEYYNNLEHPYYAKDAPFEVLDELLLLKGMDKQIYKQLIKYATVYGDGKVNINTASKPVLSALGLSEELVEKILSVRRGGDGVEATGDVYIFLRTYHVVSHIKQFMEVSSAEAAQIDQLNFSDRLTTNSYYYSIYSLAYLDNSREKKAILCVFNKKDDKIEYWREY